MSTPPTPVAGGSPSPSLGLATPLRTAGRSASPQHFPRTEAALTPGGVAVPGGYSYLARSNSIVTSARMQLPTSARGTAPTRERAKSHSASPGLRDMPPLPLDRRPSEAFTTQDPRLAAYARPGVRHVSAQGATTRTLSAGTVRSFVHAFEQAQPPAPRRSSAAYSRDASPTPLSAPLLPQPRTPLDSPVLPRARSRSSFHQPKSQEEVPPVPPLPTLPPSQRRLPLRVGSEPTHGTAHQNSPPVTPESYSATTPELTPSDVHQPTPPVSTAATLHDHASVNESVPRATTSAEGASSCDASVSAMPVPVKDTATPPLDSLVRALADSNLPSAPIKSRHTKRDSMLTMASTIPGAWIEF